MLWRSIALAVYRVQYGIRRHSVSSKFSPQPHHLVHHVDEEEEGKARTWLSKFDVKDVPKNICEIFFSRASGPGGQNVNKYVALVGIYSRH